MLKRVDDLLNGLAMIVVTGAASRHSRETPRRASRQERDFQGRQEPLLLAFRAALAMLLLSGVWMATGWNEGFTAVSGGAIMLFFGVNQDNPQAGARTYLVWSSLGILLAYLLIALVLPFLQDFGALAVLLLLILLPPDLWPVLRAVPGQVLRWAGGPSPRSVSAMCSSRMNLPTSTARPRWSSA